MRWARTSEAVFTADFATVGGGVVALSALPTVTILNPSLQVVLTGVGVSLGDGVYSFTWTVPADAVLGMWKINWLGNSTDGYQMPGEEWFEVTEAGSVYISPPVALLRNFVDRRLPGMVDTDLFFTDDEIHSLYFMSGLDVWMGAYQGWIIKSGVFADLIDISESGASRKFSQRYANAVSQAEYFRKKVVLDLAQRSGYITRMAGKAFTLRGDAQDIFGIYTVAGLSPAGQFYVQTYRMPDRMPWGGYV